MGVGELYGLFACMVTRRSWKSVTGGIGKSKMNESEKDELRMYASSLIPQISEVLSRMPREMLLILKTNDLMRNIEHKLGVFGSSDCHLEVRKVQTSSLETVIIFRCQDASFAALTKWPFDVRTILLQNFGSDSACIGRF